MKTLTQYATRIDLSNDVLERIQRYLENHNQDKDSLEDQDSLLKILPPALKSEVNLLTQKSITKQSWFFFGKSKDFVRRVI